MSVAESTHSGTDRSVGHFSLNTRKARYGVSYFRAICSQAGVGFSETSPDEDQLAVDGLVALRTGYVPVQIKCSSQFKIAGPSANWPAEKAWIEKWRAACLPVYFVLVILDHDEPDRWINHHNAGTAHCSGAFWVRVDRHGPVGNIVVPKTQRLSADTMAVWERDLHQAYASAEEV
jgi:hypothetical protein